MHVFLLKERKGSKKNLEVWWLSSFCIGSHNYMGGEKDLERGRPRTQNSGASGSMNFDKNDKRAIANSSLVSEAITSLPFKVQGHNFRVKDTKHLSKHQTHCRSLVKTAAFHHCPLPSLMDEESLWVFFHSADVVFNSRHCRITVTQPP